jgi:hypothetical protein
VIRQRSVSAKIAAAINSIIRSAAAMNAMAPPPRCSSLVMILNYPGLLTQPDARLRPTSHRRVVGGLRQHEVLDARQLVHDLSIVIHQLDAVFEMAANARSPRF